MSRIEFIQNKYDEWLQYLTNRNLQPGRIYISYNWFNEMLDEVNQGLFSETIFNNRQGCRVYKGYPLIIIQDSDYFIVEADVCHLLKLLKNDTLTTAKQSKQLNYIQNTPSTV